jgi:septum site-determining protein MinC
MKSTTSRQTNSAFQFKASFSPCLIIEIHHHDLHAITKQLHETAQTSPQFFSGSPVVIDLDKLHTSKDLAFTDIKSLLQQQGLIPIGIRGGNSELQEAARLADLPLVNIGKVATKEKPAPKAVTQNSTPANTRIITQPIRSGMQIYAKDSDLIVTTQVSPGAELMAHGHIHVYGALRGRALAGVHGNTEARIFCRTLDAELIAIAGFYLTRDELAALNIPTTSNLIQIFLHNDRLQIEPL